MERDLINEGQLIGHEGSGDGTEICHSVNLADLPSNSDSLHVCDSNDLDGSHCRPISNSGDNSGSGSRSVNQCDISADGIEISQLMSSGIDTDTDCQAMDDIDKSSTLAVKSLAPLEQRPSEMSATSSSIRPVLPSVVTSSTLLPTEGSGIVPVLQNVVCTVDLGCRLDLKKIALHARNAEYNPKRFAAVIMRIREPRTTALIFSSGKMVCTGARNEDLAQLASRKYARLMQKLGFPARFIDFKIQNIVASTDVKFAVRLEGLIYAQPNFCSYEPEIFPGLIYRMVRPRVVLLIFVSGKIVLTGAKNRSQIAEAFDNIYPILRGFKKQ